MLQDPAPGGATYSSHVPQTGANASGLWLTFQDTEATAGGIGARWSLWRSTNGGASWSRYYQSGLYDGPPPSMHTDRENEVWVFEPTFTGGSAPDKAMVHLHRFLPEPPYNGQHDIIVSFEASKSAKHTSIYDPSVSAFYFMGQGGDFLVVDPAGAVTRRTQMFVAGAGSGMGYPHMSLDGNRLYIGGTVAGDSAPVTYRDCLIGYSDDTGITVRNLGGTPLSFPITFAPDAGFTSFLPPSWRQHDVWLQGIAPRPDGSGVVGMVWYTEHVTHTLAAPPAASPGSTVNWSVLADANGACWDGYGILVRDGDDLYAISGGPVPGAAPAQCILIMKWTGTGWQTVARTEEGAFSDDYAIAGMRRRTPGQPIVFTFTDQRAPQRWNQRMMVGVFNP